MWMRDPCEAARGEGTGCAGPGWRGADTGDEGADEEDVTDDDDMMEAIAGETPEPREADNCCGGCGCGGCCGV